MAIQVIPDERSPVKEFAGNLATGLGSSLGQAAGKGIGAGLGALGTGLGRMTGLVDPEPRLTREMLTKAGFKDADIDILLNTDKKSQPMLMNMMIGKYGREEQKEKTGYTDEVLRKLGLNKRNRELVLATDPKDQPGMVKYLGERQDVNDVDEEDIDQPQQQMPAGDVMTQQGMESSGMGQPGGEKSISDTLSTMSPQQPGKKVFGQTPEQKRREADELRKDEKVRLMQENVELNKQKLQKAEEAPERKRISDKVNSWNKVHDDAKEAQREIKKILTIPQENFTPALLRQFFTKMGYGDAFKNAGEQAYEKIAQKLITDEARNLVSTGKMTAAMFEVIGKRFPKLTNTAEGRRILQNVLHREKQEQFIPYETYKEFRKKYGITRGKETAEFIDMVEDEISKRRSDFDFRSENELRKDFGQPEIIKGPYAEDPDLQYDTDSDRYALVRKDGNIIWLDEEGNPIAE